MRSCNFKGILEEKPLSITGYQVTKNVGKGVLIVFLDNFLVEMLRLNKNDVQF